MERKFRIGAVSYLNTKPLIYGFQHGMMNGEIDLVMDYPSSIASMLIKNEIDAGLVPISIISELNEQYNISDYCISCDGEVGSVCLFSDVPLSEIETILLDYQSSTSVELIKVLIREFWKIKPVIRVTSNDYQIEIKGTTAGLVIGDRSFTQRKISPYIYDLGMEWKKFTGMPFVFAAWVSNVKPSATFINAFNEANNFGLQNLDKVIAENPYSLFDLRAYYTSYINYTLDENKRKAMCFFLQKSFSKNVTQIDFI